MSLDSRAANTNDPAIVSGVWGAWPGLAANMAVWTTVTAAGLDTWATFQKAWLDAARDSLRRQRGAFLLAQDDADGPAAPLLTATVEDIRECGEALMQAQIDALDAWRRAG